MQLCSILIELPSHFYTEGKIIQDNRKIQERSKGKERNCDKPSKSILVICQLETMEIISKVPAVFYILYPLVKNFYSNRRLCIAILERSRRRDLIHFRGSESQEDFTK
ncbi:hypothetical protein ANTQUA_LOCUS7563 [Anthophora quadrimaculata]